jgi:hypothetical protein
MKFRSNEQELSDMDDQGFDTPGWAVFMTQNTDRPFCETLLDAMNRTRVRRELGLDARVSWLDVADALADELVWRALCDVHGEALAIRVKAQANAGHASARAEDTSTPGSLHRSAPDT